MSFVVHHQLASDDLQQRDIDVLSAERVVVEQAKGVLMLQYGITAETAAALLSGWSRQIDVDLRSIATALTLRIAAGEPVSEVDLALVRWLEHQLRRGPDTDEDRTGVPVHRPEDSSEKQTTLRAGRTTCPADNGADPRDATEVQVIPHSGGGWQVRYDGRTLGVYDLVAQAIQVATDQSRINRAAHVVVYSGRGQEQARVKILK